jgi:hypothetical protein
MTAPLNTCTTIEQRGVVGFLWAKNMDAAKDIHKEMLPISAAFLCGYPLPLGGWKSRYLGTTLSYENSIQEEIKSRLKSGNGCYLSV